MKIDRINPNDWTHLVLLSGHLLAYKYDPETGACDGLLEYIVQIGVSPDGTKVGRRPMVFSLANQTELTPCTVERSRVTASFPFSRLCDVDVGVLTALMKNAMDDMERINNEYRAATGKIVLAGAGALPPLPGGGFQGPRGRG